VHVIDSSTAIEPKSPEQHQEPCSLQGLLHQRPVPADGFQLQAPGELEGRLLRESEAFQDQCAETFITGDQHAEEDTSFVERCRAAETGCLQIPI